MNEQNNNFNNEMSNIPQNPMNDFNSMNQPIQPQMQQQPMPQQQPVMGQPNINYGQQMPNNKGKNKFLVPLIIGIVAVFAAIAIILVVVLGGKGGTKTLTCTSTQSMYGMELSAEAKMYFKADEVQSLDMLMTLELGSYASYKDTFIESFEQEYASFEEQNIDVDISSDSSNVYIKIKADKDNYEDAEIISSESYDEVKEELESQGFTCK